MPLLPTGVTASAAQFPLSASQIRQGSNSITAVYSGNSIAIACCTAQSPPGGGTQVPIYPSAVSPPIQVSCRSSRAPAWNGATESRQRAGVRSSRLGARAAPPC
jgi:hypothetical protein